MRFIRALALCALCIILLGNKLFAGTASVRPVSPFSENFFTSVKKVDADFPLREISHDANVKICSCQILNLESANYQHRHVVVLAEKTNHGNYSSGYRVAKGVIEKEKKHLRLFFYDKIKVVNKFAQSTDCKSLFIKLKELDQSLVMYDILDADVKR